MSQVLNARSIGLTELRYEMADMKYCLIKWFVIMSMTKIIIDIVLFGILINLLVRLGNFLRIIKRLGKFSFKQTFIVFNKRSILAFGH